MLVSVSWHHISHNMDSILAVSSEEKCYTFTHDCFFVCKTTPKDMTRLNYIFLVEPTDVVFRGGLDRWVLCFSHVNTVEATH